jgi:CRISPR/Cas system-associated exonuclease Cas4 (RecB family)
MLRLVASPAAAARRSAALDFLRQLPPASEALVVGASRGAADDLVREIAAAGATFGLSRFSLAELAARIARDVHRGHRMAGGSAGSEAIAVRATFDAMAADELEYFAPVASMPGFPRALARTVHELRLAGLTGADLGSDAAVSDIGRLLARVESQLDQAAVEDRAGLFRTATDAARAGATRWTGLPIVFLDVAAESPVEIGFMRALVDRAPNAFATLPEGDERVRTAFVEMGGAIEQTPDSARADGDIAHLRRFIFSADTPPEREQRGDVCMFSAPGEGREAIEIVRRVLVEARRGVPFDQMAVLIRTPQHYLGLLEHACARGGVPVYFDRGTRRPDPSGRAFIALLSCAVEGLSAKRFDEYLSLGQVPRLDSSSRPLAVIRPLDEEMSGDRSIDRADSDDPEDVVPGAPLADSDEEAIVSGTLRSPWKWEELIVESAVVGGRSRADARDRWRRRLDGLAADYRLRLQELRRDEPDSPRVGRLLRDLKNLAHLRGFALPIVDTLAEWPERAMWGEWLQRLQELAGAALWRPNRVLQTLLELQPMAEVGPISLDEARDVLRVRLATLDWEPPPSRYGRLFVGTPHQARGRTFRVAFVPGLAERLVPQRPREDPLLLDDRRERIHRALVDQDQRSAAERLLLRIAIGTASERLYLSYPRMDVAETRARVPSFYALDVMRAVTGRVPDHRVLAAEAAEEASATLAWPAPRDPDHAIDDLEHDLAVLKPLLDSRDPSVKGKAHYMLALNDALKRSVISRWSRSRAAWSPSDGIVKVTPGIAGAIQAQRLNERPYSLSALQRFASCPYQFMLATIHRLEPWDEPEPLLRMDPLTRGSLFHKVQAELLRDLKERGQLPVTRATMPEAARRLDAVLARVAAEYEENLVPAIDRVWRDEIGDLAHDLAIWVRKLADEADWRPEFFEFSFGLNDEGRDPRSLPDPVRIEGGFLLRGSVDAIEEHADGRLRVTDYKTGRNRSKPDLIVDGGKVLQPVLYSVVVEEALRRKVAEGRLFYCTTAGGFADHRIPLDDYRRRQGLEVLAIVDRAIERGFLVAAPADGACRWCDFQTVCGPREEERIARKNRAELADLQALRSMR